MKGQFTYQNKRFKYNFSVIEWANCKGYGAGRIDYKYKLFQIGEFFYIDRNQPYEALLYKYENMKNDQLEEVVKNHIIKHYNELELKKKWRY